MVYVAGMGVETLNLEVATLDEVSDTVARSAGFVIGSPTLGGHMPTQVVVPLICNVMCVAHSSECGRINICSYLAEAGCSVTIELMLRTRAKGRVQYPPANDGDMMKWCAAVRAGADGAGGCAARRHGARAALRRVWQLWVERRGGRRDGGPPQGGALVPAMRAWGTVAAISTCKLALYVQVLAFIEWYTKNVLYFYTHTRRRTTLS